jgi:SAM-dependent methyltransferase
MAGSSAHIDWLSRLPGAVRARVLARQQRRADALLSQFVRYVRPGERVLDIGSGEGLLADGIRRCGFDVTMLDVVDKCVLPGIRPVVYDGVTLPCADDAFGTALLITVLHHIPDPEHTLREARRTARRVIVVEDVFLTQAEKRATMLADSWVNWEWRGHPHSNRSDAQWRATFARLGFAIANSNEQIHRLWPWRFRHATYVLDRC